MWQVFIFSVAFASYYAIEVPILWIYQQNNTHRTYETHMKKERAYKKEQREKEEA